MSWAKLERLIGQLPRQSRTTKLVVGDKARWGETDYLLANVYDAVNALTWITVSAHSAKGKRPPKPRPMLRPGQHDPSRQRLGNARIPIESASKWIEKRRRKGRRRRKSEVTDA